jgi:hypothetical protein
VSSVPASPLDDVDIRVTQSRIAVSEWTKLRSLRSTRWSLLVAAVLAIGLPILFAVVTSSEWGSMSANEQADTSALDIGLAGVYAAQLAIGILGVLLISGEYSTGMIRATLTAVPKRVPALWAKALVFAYVVFMLMLPAVLIAFFASQAILSGHDVVQGSFSDPGVARSLFGGAAYLAILGVFTLGIGAILRNTAGGIAAFAGVMFVIPPLLLLLPKGWDTTISPYLPDASGRAVFAVGHDSNLLAPWTGFGVFCAWAAGTLAVAAVLLLRRDA